VSLLNPRVTSYIQEIYNNEWVRFQCKSGSLFDANQHRANLTRFHGVFAPNSKHRALVTPAKRGKGRKPKGADGHDKKTPVQRHAAMTWAQRLKRVFNINVETCRICGGTAKVIACIEDPVVIKKILMHLEEKAPMRAAPLLPDSRAPPQSSLFG
jgi:hypothetical protein